MYSYGPSYMAEQKQDDQLEHTYDIYVRIQDVALKTCQKRWTMGRSSERGSGISVLAARHDDDDDYRDVKFRPGFELGSIISYDDNYANYAKHASQTDCSVCRKELHNRRRKIEKKQIINFYEKNG